jgi:hypothetical protein
MDTVQVEKSLLLLEYRIARDDDSQRISDILGVIHVVRQTIMGQCGCCLSDFFFLKE